MSLVFSISCLDLLDEISAGLVCRNQALSCLLLQGVDIII